MVWLNLHRVSSLRGHAVPWRISFSPGFLLLFPLAPSHPAQLWAPWAELWAGRAAPWLNTQWEQSMQPDKAQLRACLRPLSPCGSITLFLDHEIFLLVGAAGISQGHQWHRAPCWAQGSPSFSRSVLCSAFCTDCWHSEGRAPSEQNQGVLSAEGLLQRIMHEQMPKATAQRYIIYIFIRNSVLLVRASRIWLQSQ